MKPLLPIAMCTLLLAAVAAPAQTPPAPASADAAPRFVDATRGPVPITAATKPPLLRNAVNDDNRLPRDYRQQPPIIPHRVDGYQVTKDFNKCLDCHARAKTTFSQAVPVSETHYVDRGGKVLDRISTRRYFCQQCHVAQEPVAPLVGNAFMGDAGAVKKLKRGGTTMLAAIKRFWNVIRKPSTHYSLGFLTIGGFIGGIVFWGGFNTAMEATNTEAFCTGCHEMRDNVFAELRTTIHYTNRSGVRAICSDCHVPHAWTDKMARKMQASKEVWGKVFGTIDTPEKFRAMRLELARHEWARLKANDSLECRNCHQFESMDFTRQSVRAQNMHSTFLANKEKTCIDCHKGIAHKLPFIPPGEAPTDTPGQVVPMAAKAGAPVEVSVQDPADAPSGAAR